MDGIRLLLDTVRDKDLARGRLRGLFHIAIGRRVTRADGTVISTGVTWRQLASLLKEAKLDKDLARELGVDPDSTSPRDREKMWYTAIQVSGVDSVEARAQADELCVRLKPLGFVIGPPPPGSIPRPNTPPAPGMSAAGTAEQQRIQAQEAAKKKKK